MRELKAICAYFDTQGFYYNNVYHPIEVAMLSSIDTYLWSCRVAKNCSCLESHREWCQKNYLVSAYHGLEATPEGHSLEETGDLIRATFHGLTTSDQYIVGVRSFEAEYMMKRLGIPYVNLQLVYGATFDKISTGRKECLIHKPGLKPMKCSINIVMDLKNYCKTCKCTAAHSDEVAKTDYVFIPEEGGDYPDCWF